MLYPPFDRPVTRWVPTIWHRDRGWKQPDGRICGETSIEEQEQADRRYGRSAPRSGPRNTRSSSPSGHDRAWLPGRRLDPRGRPNEIHRARQRRLAAWSGIVSALVGPSMVASGVFSRTGTGRPERQGAYKPP